MSCTNPLTAYKTPHGITFNEADKDAGRILQIPCGQCQHCRLQRRQQWELRITHESKLHADNSFVTLTYSDDNLPPHGTLRHRDFQLFMKRLRHHSARPVRFFMAGEYGETTNRAHYHACIFGEGFRNNRKPKGKSASGHLFYEDDTLTKLWGLGNATVQDLVPQSAAYCAGYIMKKALGKTRLTAYQITTEEGEIIQRQPEYSKMSLNPGIGAFFADIYHEDFMRHDHAVHEGRQLPVPRYYQNRLSQLFNYDLDQMKANRELEAAKHASNNTRKRLNVRETVLIAKMRRNNPEQL